MRSSIVWLVLAVGTVVIGTTNAAHEASTQSLRQMHGPIVYTPSGVNKQPIQLNDLKSLRLKSVEIAETEWELNKPKEKPLEVSKFSFTPTPKQTKDKPKRTLSHEEKLKQIATAPKHVMYKFDGQNSDERLKTAFIDMSKMPDELNPAEGWPLITNLVRSPGFGALRDEAGHVAGRAVGGNWYIGNFVLMSANCNKAGSEWANAEQDMLKGRKKGSVVLNYRNRYYPNRPSDGAYTVTSHFLETTYNWLNSPHFDTWAEYVQYFNGFFPSQTGDLLQTKLNNGHTDALAVRLAALEKFDVSTNIQYKDLTTYAEQNVNYKKALARLKEYWQQIDSTCQPKPGTPYPIDLDSGKGVISFDNDTYCQGRIVKAVVTRDFTKQKPVIKKNRARPKSLNLSEMNKDSKPTPPLQIPSNINNQQNQPPQFIPIQNPTKQFLPSEFFKKKHFRQLFVKQHRQQRRRRRQWTAQQQQHQQRLSPEEVMHLLHVLPKTNDQAGHIVSDAIGGPLHPLNLLPMSASMNAGGRFAEAEKKLQTLWKSDDLCESLSYTLEFFYANPLNPLRPSHGVYTINGKAKSNADSNACDMSGVKYQWINDRHVDQPQVLWAEFLSLLWPGYNSDDQFTKNQNLQSIDHILQKVVSQTDV